MTNFKTCFVALVVVLFMASSCGNNFEKCDGQPICQTAPISASASDGLKKIRETMAGKWKLYRTATIDTLHKTSGEFKNRRADMCVSYDGGVRFFIDDHKPVCAYCYDLTSAGEMVKITVDQTAKMTPFCEQMLQSGDFSCVGDSLVITSRDSFVVKRAVYRRMNEDGSFKAN